MSALTDHINELKAAEAFSKQSNVFDEVYSADLIIQYKRERVRQHILKHVKSPASMLELNCGTGEDALFFASKGFYVHATDISEGMLQKLWLKKHGRDMQWHVRERERERERERVTTELCSFTELSRLKHKGPFDAVYSNFGGLNCTAEIGKVMASFDQLVKPGGTVTLVLISKFCLWETLLVFKGKFKTAFRRFFSRNGRKAKVEGRQFTCWYYSVADIKKHLPSNFYVIDVEGLCTIVPPSYIERFAEKRPRLFEWLKRKEDGLKSSWPWRYIGDYIIVTVQKR
jgi:ubiquinone/menaquinone biosynthesis C-methylase UbiE